MSGLVRPVRRSTVPVLAFSSDSERPLIRGSMCGAPRRHAAALWAAPRRNREDAFLRFPRVARAERPGVGAGTERAHLRFGRIVAGRYAEVVSKRDPHDRPSCGGACE